MFFVREQPRRAPVTLHVRTHVTPMTAFFIAMAIIILGLRIADTHMAASQSRRRHRR